LWVHVADSGRYHVQLVGRQLRTPTDAEGTTPLGSLSIGNTSQSVLSLPVSDSITNRNQRDSTTEV